MWWIAGAVVVAIFCYGIYSEIKKEMYVFFPKDTWLKIKKVTTDFDGPEYIRTSRDITGDTSWWYAHYDAFEPDGNIKEGRMNRVETIANYELAAPAMAAKLEKAYQKRQKATEEATLKNKKEMQAKALKAFTKG